MKKILAALDGSPRQERVLEAALDQVRRVDGRLSLFRVVSIPSELPAEAFSLRPEAVGDLLLERARTELEALAKRVPEANLDEVRAVLGTPWRTIVEAADQRRADLIVVGSHGYGGMDRLLGTTAAKVVDHAHCSVLVAR